MQRETDSGFHRAFHVAGNRLVPLTNGRERLDALLGLIDGAEGSLRLLYYIFLDDATGRRVRDALIAALGRGVAVTLIVDGFGSDDADAAFFRPLDAAGATFCRFLPRLGRRYLLRNHQKLAVADGRIAIIGGFNVSDAYFGEAPAANWRDLGLRVEGPTVRHIAEYYDVLADWTRQTRGKLRDLRRALDRWSERSGRVRWLLGGPARRLSPWALEVKQEMRRARSLDMIAAYFAPNPAMLRRVEGVARGGGRARVVTAALSDNTATVSAARHTYRRLLRRGVEVYEYQPTKLHTKLYVIDDCVHIGSANFDMRSLYLNLELMLRVEDAAFARAMRGYFERELGDCAQITREGHRARARWWDRLRWTLAYFVVGVLDYGVTRRLNFGPE